MKKALLVTLFVGAFASQASAQCAGNVAAGSFCGNSAASSGLMRAATPTAMFDRAFCSTANSALARIGGSWVCLASANNGVWVTSAAGVPSISSTLPNAVQDNITRLGTIASGAVPSTLVTYLATGTGATSVTQHAHNSNILWASEFGAVCDSVTDDATAFNNLINAAENTGKEARFRGTCRIGSSITINGGVKFGGVDTRSSHLIPDTGVTVISFATTFPVHIENLTISTANAGTTGIRCHGTDNTAPNANIRSIVSGVWIESLTVGLDIVNCGQFTLRDSYFNSSTSQNVVINNPHNCDAGDNGFYNNTFIQGVASSIGVYLRCGGGQRFIGNKFNSVNTAIAFALRNGDTLTGTNATAWLFANNSIEGSDYCFDIQRPSGTDLLINVQIIGNEMVCRIGISIQASSTWVWNVSITGNTWFGQAGGANVFALINGVNGLHVGPNITHATVAGTVAFSFGANNTAGTVYFGPTTRSLTAPGTYAADTLNGAIALTTNALPITDNQVVRGDGGAQGVQGSAVSIDDSGNLTGIGTVTTSGAINGVTLNNNAWSTYTPTVTASSGTFTTVSATGRYQQVGKTLHIAIRVVITTAGTATNLLQVSMPGGITPIVNSPIYGWGENTNKGISGSVGAGGSTIVVLHSDATAPIADGRAILISGTMEVN